MSRLSKISNYIGTKTGKQDLEKFLSDVDKDLQHLYTAINNYLEVSRITVDNNTYAHFHLMGDPANATPADGDLWFNGTNLKMRIGVVTYNIDMTGE
jgi:hypothetical protein